MLQKLLTCLQNEKIEFFWHRDCNLLDTANPSAIKNAYFRLKNIIKDLDKTPKDATLVKKYLGKLVDVHHCKISFFIIC